MVDAAADRWAVDKPMCERCAGVRAGVVKCEELARDMKHTNHQFTCGEHAGLTLGYVVNVADRLESGHAPSPQQGPLLSQHFALG